MKKRMKSNMALQTDTTKSLMNVDPAPFVSA